MTKPTHRPSVDFSVQNHGSLYIFQPLTERARQWWDEHCQQGMDFGPGHVVEHRYAGDILAGIEDDGMTVEGLV